MRVEKEILSRLRSPLNEGAGPGLWHKFNPKGKGKVGDFGNLNKHKYDPDDPPMFVDPLFLKDAGEDMGIKEVLTNITKTLALPGYKIRVLRLIVANYREDEAWIWWLPINIQKGDSPGLSTTTTVKDPDRKILVYFMVDIWGEVKGMLEFQTRRKLGGPLVTMVRKTLKLGQIEGKTGPSLKKSFQRFLNEFSRWATGKITQVFMRQFR